MGFFEYFSGGVPIEEFLNPPPAAPAAAPAAAPPAAAPPAAAPPAEKLYPTGAGATRTADLNAMVTALNSNMGLGGDTKQAQDAGQTNKKTLLGS